MAARTRTHPAAIPTASYPWEAFAALAARVEQSEARIAALEAAAGRRSRPRDSDDLAVFREVCTVVTGRRFSARELHEVAAGEHPDKVTPLVAAALAAALVAADADSPRSIGRLLRRCEGHDVDGWTLERDGADRDGIVWVLRVSRVSRTRPEPGQD